MPTMDVKLVAGMEPTVALVYGTVISHKNRLTDLIRDLTPEQLEQRPQGFKNSIAALVVHVCGTEVWVAHQFLGQPFPDQLKAEFFRDRPQNPIPQPTGETAESLIGKIEKSRRYVEQGCANLKTADLEREISLGPDRSGTLRWMLALLPIHIAQHFGQMQMIKQHLT